METLCRLCMSIGAVGMEPIFLSVMGNCLAAKVVSVTQLTLYEGDGLPASVCQQCIFKLDVSDSFIQKCKVSDRALRAMQAVQKEFETPPRHFESSRDWRNLTDQSVDPFSLNAKREKSVLQFGPSADRQKDDREVLAIDVIDAVKIEDSGHVVSPGAGEIDNSSHTSDNPSPKDIINNSRIQKSKQIEHFSKSDYLSNDAGKDKGGISCSLNTETEKEVDAISLQPAEKSNSCDICQREFSSKNSLASHAKRIHPKRPNARKSHRHPKVTNDQKENGDIPDKGMLTNSTALQSLTKRKEPRALSKFPCTMCKRRFASQISLKKHFQRHLAMQSVTKETLTEPILLHCEEQQHACPQCGKRFTKLLALSMHMVMHSDERPFKCENCLVRFKRKEHMTRHMKRCNSGQQCRTKRRLKKQLPEQCKNSPEQVSEASKQCTSERPSLGSPRPDHEVVPKNLLRCRICGQNFSTLTDHKSHMQSHKGDDEKLFSCKVCGHTFRNRPDLESHLPSHDVSREFLFPCTVCGRRFTSEARVACHMSIHVRAARHKCPKCTRCFQTAFALKEHKKLHEADGQFMCSICNETFSGQEGLQSHLLSHANDHYVDSGKPGESLDFQPPESHV